MTAIYFSTDDKVSLGRFVFQADDFALISKRVSNGQTLTKCDENFNPSRINLEPNVKEQFQKSHARCI